MSKYMDDLFQKAEQYVSQRFGEQETRNYALIAAVAQLIEAKDPVLKNNSNCEG